MANIQYIGARYVPKFYEGSNGDNWDSGVSYEPLTVVQYLNESYTSKKPVPNTIGNPAQNPNYWAHTGAYNAQVEQYRREVANMQELIGNEELETEADTITGAINEIFGNVGDGNINEYYDNITDAVNKLSVFVTPEMFGAVGDGENDDTDAVKAAIANGDIVYMAGTYKISDELVIDKPIKIVGKPFRRTQSGFETHYHIVNSNPEINTVMSLHSTGVILEDLLIECDGTTGIALSTGCYHCFFKNVEIYNSLDAWNIARCWNLMFTGCIVNNATRAGWRMTETVTSSEWSACVAYNCVNGWHILGAIVYSTLNACGTDHTNISIRFEGTGELVCNNLGAEDYKRLITILNSNAKIILVGCFTYNKNDLTEYTITGTGTVLCYGCEFNSDDTYSIDKLYGYNSNTPNRDGHVTNPYFGQALKLPVYSANRELSSLDIAVPSDYYYVLHVKNTDSSVKLDFILDETDVDNDLLVYSASTRTANCKQGVQGVINAYLKTQ